MFWAYLVLIKEKLYLKYEVRPSTPDVIGAIDLPTLGWFIIFKL
jgi:hypothetical protein